jgi:hypothetical protein
MNPTFLTLTLQPQGTAVCRVLTPAGQHVGNLKHINGQWKFKAIGYSDHGEIIPGGGPLTERHNTTFKTLDAAVVSAALGYSSEKWA